MKRTIPIDTNITLKALVESDAIRMFNIINKEREYLGEWLPFVQFTKKVDDSKGFVEMAMLSRKLKKDYVYKICLNDRMIGLIGTKETDMINRNTEIGYWLSEEFQNQGIMTKSVSALIKTLFDDLNIERVQICCAIGNEKSINIPKRLGFKLEGTKRNGEWIGNYQFRDLLVFSKLKSDEEQ